MRTPMVTTRFLERAATYYGDQVGVVANDGTEFTYGEFADRVDRLSNAFLGMGLETGDRVALLSSNTHQYLEAMNAAVQLGLLVVPLNYRLTPGDYEYLLSDSGASVVVAEGDLAGDVDAVRDSVPTDRFVRFGDPADGWEDYGELLESHPPEVDRPDLDEDHPTGIYYTSGTTGDPKGVVRTHRNDHYYVFTLGHYFGLGDGDTYLWTLPMFHLNGWMMTHGVTGFGATHVCQRYFDAEATFENVREHDVSRMICVPTMLNRLIERYEEHGPFETTGDADLRVVTAGSAPPEATIRTVEDEFGWELVHVYGHTETGSPITSHSPRRIREEGKYAIKRRQGIPEPGMEMRVVDEDGEDVPRDDETLGEVVIRGNQVFDRYWKEPEATEEAFSDRVEGWFHTGDLATVDGNGMIAIRDRKKDIIVSGGENISSVEVENVLYEHPDISKAAVIPVPSEEWGETPRAVVVPKPGADLTEEGVIGFTRERLANFKCPTGVDFRDDLPETATGKVEKYKLREDYWEGDRRVGEG